MNIYISGPITGTTDYKERFITASDHLLKQGHRPINPVAIAEDIKKRLPMEPAYETYMAIDLAILEMADAIYMLKGFEDSNGARVERMRAVQRGKQIFYQGDSDSEKLLAMA